MTGPKADPPGGDSSHPPPEADYSRWSRDDLIARLRALEGKLPEGSEANRTGSDLRDHQTRSEALHPPSPHLSDATPVGYLAVDQAGVIRVLNTTGARMLANASASFEGQPLAAYLDPADVEPFQAFLEALFEKGQAARIELRLQSTPAGPPRYVALEGLPPTDHQLDSPVVPLILTDLTEIKTAQAQQARVNRALRALNAVHNAERDTADPEAMLHRICNFLTGSIGFQLAVVMAPGKEDREALATVTSAGSERLLECALDPATWNMPEPADGPLKAAADCSQPLLARARQAESMVEAERSSEAMPCFGLNTAAALPLRTDEGLLGVLGLYTTAPDAFESADMAWLDEVAAEVAGAWRQLELRRARQALEKEQAWLTQILDASPDFVTIADARGKVLYRNQGALRLLGYAAHELPLGTSMDRDYAPWAVDRMHATVLPAVRQSGIWRGELALLCRAGREIPIFQVTIAHRDENGELVRLSTIGHDLSALKRQRLDLERQSHLAALGELASVLAHQINQPLTAAINFAEGTRNHLANMADPPDSLRSGLDKVLEHVHQAGSIVQSLRHFLEESQPRLQPVDLNHLIRELVPAVTYQGPEAPYHLQLDLDPELPTGEADPVQLQEALLNCINNAIEAMAEDPPEDPEVRITTCTIADNLEIRVRDRGPGLPENLRDSTHRPLFTTKASGLGLGLSICHSVMEAHGGRFWAAANANDLGTTFHLTLPLTNPQRPT